MESARRIKQFYEFEVALVGILAALLVAATVHGSVTVISASAGITTLVDPCNPSDISAVPFTLDEGCCPRNTTNCQTYLPNCEDPYDAYIKWCEPEVCHAFSEKGRYLQAMQIMSAFGGLWGLLGLLILCCWRCCWQGCCGSVTSHSSTAAGAMLPPALVCNGAASPLPPPPTPNLQPAPTIASAGRTPSLQPLMGP
jgi:hypothetical protein